MEVCHLRYFVAVVQEQNGGFKDQVQQRIIKIDQEIAQSRPWKRWKTKSVSHFPTARLRVSL